MATKYITTAIPYVNAPPHIGFALEMIQADCLARHYRRKGHEVRFQAGSDENSLKNVQAAEALGVPVQDLVRDNAAKFVSLKRELGLSVDDFIRTSCDKRHADGVERLWHRIAARGDVYKGTYRGLYCTGCEHFYKPSELDGGLCPEHRTRPEEIAEENYFFRLSRYQEALRRLIADGDLEIVPATRRNEVLSVIDGGLEDFSISRSSARARGWGLPVPGDPGQVIYVWFDALGNYITALGYSSDAAPFDRFWTRADTREHVIGKGISRFHAIYWPAMLLSAGVALPTRVYVHGYVTVEGVKIGKSAGNAVDPVPLARSHGADALRYALLRHIKGTGDGDFSREVFQRSYTSDLAGQLGNLVHRTTSMIERYCAGIVPRAHRELIATPPALQCASQLAGRVDAAIESFRFDEALDAIWACLAALNKHVTDTEPWSLAKQAGAHGDPAALATARVGLETSLADTVAGIVSVARCLAPLLPATSGAILERFGVEGNAAPTALEGSRVASGPLMFPPVD